MTTKAKFPFKHAAGGGTSNRDWWPNQLRIDLLHQHSSKSDPMGEDFDYAKEFESLDFAAVKKDLAASDDRVAALVAGRLRPLRPACSFAWRGTPPAPTAPAMAGAAAVAVSSASPRSTVGRTTSASTKPAGSFGRSSKSMAARFHGPTS